MFVFLFYVSSLFAGQSCHYMFQKAKENLFLKKSVSLSKKTTYKALSLCKTEEEIYPILNFMDEYLEIGLDKIYAKCKTKLNNCAYFKAKIYENIGNISVAKNIYKQNSFYGDFIASIAKQGQNPIQYIEFKYLNRSQQNYYSALYHYYQGNWTKTLSWIKADNLKSLRILFLSHLMLGNLDKAKNLLIKYKNKDPEDTFVKFLLNGILLYANNKMTDAKKIFEYFLLYKPHDYLALKYLAQIYYRGGYFKKADKIYKNLLSIQWQATERFYLLKERIIMSIMYKKFDLAKTILDKTLREYPNRKDLLKEASLLFAKYLNFKQAKHYANLLKSVPVYYYETMAYISSYSLNDKLAVSYAKLAYISNKTKYYKDLLLNFKQNLISRGKLKIKCSDYKVYKQKGMYYIRRVFDSFVSNYYLNFKTRTIIVPIKYNYPKWLNAKELIKNWQKAIIKYWSIGGWKIKILNKNISAHKTNLINIQWWPSSFYRKRVSIDDWVLLMPSRVAVHEFGHLLGLNDEYFERDKKINTVRAVIGKRKSIMRNAVSGKPSAEHLNIITSVYRTCNEL